VVCIAFFVAFITFSIFKTNFQSIDAAVNLWIITLHNSTAILVAKILSIIFDTIILSIVSLIIAGVLFIKNQKTLSLLLLTTVGGNALFVAIIKTLTQVARPENQLLSGSGYSYPSGHSAGVIVFMGLIVYSAWLNWHNSKRAKILSSTSFGLVVAFVSFDRIYLNVHWLSDVVGGCLFGAFWLSFCIAVYELLNLTGKFKS
jgi:undecaprenyl-diphosphatase